MRPKSAIGIGAPSRQLIMLIFTALAAFPIYFMLVNAFKSNAEYVTNAFGPPHDWTTETMRQALSSGSLYRWLANSALITAASVGISTTLAAFAAYPIALMRWRAGRYLLAVLISLMAVPPIVLVIPLFQEAVSLQVLNTYGAVIVIYTGLLLPFSTFLLATFFRGLPFTLFEAARIDGAGTLRILLAIVIPLSRAALMTVVIVQALWVWNEVLIALVFLQHDNLRTLMVGLTVFQSRYHLDVPLVMAGMLWATIPMVALFLAGQRFFVRGLTAGGIKG
ncbi:MAG: raffinose/stachyose/melibiose transport system permease protein [Gaiellales bacterium]|nr:raffinose/stachyose/melibiose transport system permease protein [Gaiellales bacterium]